MALVNCWECGQEVSESAASCPKCGATARPSVTAVSEDGSTPPLPGPTAAAKPPTSQVRKVANVIGIIWLVLFAAAAVWFFVLPHSVVLHDGSVTVKQGEYWSERFVLRWDATVSVSARVASGPAVDVYLMDPAQVGLFTSGRKYSFVTTLSQGNTRSFEKSARLPEGDYVLLVDDSIFGDAKPPLLREGSVTVELKVSAKR